MQTIESNMSVISACVRVVAVMRGMLRCCTVTLGLGQGRQFGHPHVVLLTLHLLIYACECGATSTTACPTEGSEEVFGTGTCAQVGSVYINLDLFRLRKAFL